MAGDDHPRPHRRHPGIPDLVAAPPRRTLGWNQPRGDDQRLPASPFDTWASMPQTLWAEDWPESEEPRTVAYFCGASTPSGRPTDNPRPTYRRYQETGFVLMPSTTSTATSASICPAAVTEDGFAWGLLGGARRTSAARRRWRPSTSASTSTRRIATCSRCPGSDKYRLRPDESGYDNLVLAGDWTDCGMNAGCIEAAVVVGSAGGQRTSRPRPVLPGSRLLATVIPWSLGYCTLRFVEAAALRLADVDIRKRSRDSRRDDRPYRPPRRGPLPETRQLPTRRPRPRPRPRGHNHQQHRSGVHFQPTKKGPDQPTLTGFGKD